MRIQNLILLLLLTLLTASCGKYEKLLKSNDFDAQYKAAIEYYKNQKDNRAITLFDMVETMYSQTEREDTVKFYKAKSIYRSGDFQSSSTLFDDFRKNFGRSPFLEESEYLFAMSYYRMSPKVEQDQTSTAHAIICIREYLDRYPNSPKAEACEALIVELQKKLHEKAYISAKTYFDINYFNSAILAFKNTLKQYPDTQYREEILFLILRSHFMYARNSVEAKQRSRYLDMMDAYYNFVSEYPNSTNMKAAQKMYDYVQKLMKAEESGEVTGKKEIKAFDKQEQKAFDKDQKETTKRQKKTPKVPELNETTTPDSTSNK